MRRRTRAFKHRTGFVILENVPIGVCDTCGDRVLPRESVAAGGEIAAKKKTAGADGVGSRVAAFA